MAIESNLPYENVKIFIAFTKNCITNKRDKEDRKDGAIGKIR